MQGFLEQGFLEVNVCARHQGDCRVHRKHTTESTRRESISTEMQTMQVNPYTSELSPDQERGSLSVQGVDSSIQPEKKKIFRQATLNQGPRHHYPLEQNKMTGFLTKAAMRNLEQFSNSKWLFTKQATCQLAGGRGVENKSWLTKYTHKHNAETAPKS